MKKTKILGVAASIRNKSSESQFQKILDNCNDRETLNYIIEKLAFKKLLSNSEACLLAALYGSKKEEQEIEMVRLNNYFPTSYPDRITSGKRAQLINLLQECDGLIIATPVYFGDRSSYAQSFINLMKEQNLLKNKVVGVVSVGAKRNGGQETTNIFTLWEALKESAYICSNGPKTSQYGGTAWAGGLGAIREDDYGIDTCVGTGRRVSEVVKILQDSDNKDFQKFEVSFWITKDRDGILKNNIAANIKILKEKFPSWLHFKIIDLTEKHLKRCLGCAICPFYPHKGKKCGQFRDKIQDDDMKSIYKSLIATDAIIICGYNPLIEKGISDVYQTFIERTRQIRRDNFLLTNVPVTAFSLQEVGQGNPFAMKVMASFLRHNSIILQPIEQYFEKDKISGNVTDRLEAFINNSLRIGRGRRHYKSRDTIYEAVGY